MKIYACWAKIRVKELSESAGRRPASHTCSSMLLMPDSTSLTRETPSSDGKVRPTKFSLGNV